MGRISKIAKAPPAAVEKALLKLGSNIHTARMRRKMRLEDLAERIGISRYVMSDMEKGKATTAISSYLGALWVLGLLDDMKIVGDPDNDIEGKTLEKSRTPKTAAKRRKELDNDF